MISSTKNGQIRLVTDLMKKARVRKEKDLFVVEGVKMFSELQPGQADTVFVSESFQAVPEHRTLLEGAGQVWTVTDQVFQAMSDTQTPQGILALVGQFHYSLEDMLPQDRPAHLMILENLQDPGNLGTILRAGEGAGVTGVIMSGDTVDIYNPKVIRSTMGSVLRMPFLYADDLAGTIGELKKRGVRMFAAHLSGKHNYDQEDYTGHVGFMIGNEARGLSEQTASLADTYVRIPMLGRVESLNAAVASAVLMYETARQRRNML